MDLELLSGVAPASVAQKYRIHDSSVRRHASRHLSATLLQELRASEQVGAVDLLERMVEILDDASAVRPQALLTGQSALVLKAGASAHKILETLLGHLGIEDTDVVRTLRAGEDLARSVGAVARQHPQFADALAAELDTLGATEMADDIRRITKTEHKEITS